MKKIPLKMNYALAIMIAGALAFQAVIAVLLIALGTGMVIDAIPDLGR